jgi:hypothetical protein
MSTILVPTSAPVTKPLTDEEVAEFTALTANLPHLRTHLPADLVDAAIRLEAAVWEVAQRHDVEVCPTCSVLDVADALAGNGWSTGPARDALRALVMIRGARRATTDTPVALLAAARLIGYLELRSRLG